MRRITNRFILLTAVMAVSVLGVELPGKAPIAPEMSSDIFRILATNKTSTIEKELNEAAANGYVFKVMMAGETLGGDEIVVVMSRRLASAVTRFSKTAAGRLVATSETSILSRLNPATPGNHPRAEPRLARSGPTFH